MGAKVLNQEEFQKALQENHVVLVDYWAPWCGYCRRIAPSYEKIAEQYTDILVSKINIDDEPELSAQEGIDVIPTLVLYRDGKRIASVVAPESKAKIDAFIRQNNVK